MGTFSAFCYVVVVVVVIVVVVVVVRSSSSSSNISSRGVVHSVVSDKNTAHPMAITSFFTSNLLIVTA